MFGWLRSLFRRLERESFTGLGLTVQNATGTRRDPRGPHDPAADPDSRVRVPRWRPPEDRGAFVAVAEPDDDEQVMAVSQVSASRH